MKKNLVLMLTIFVAGMAFLWGCGGGGGSSANAPEPIPASSPNLGGFSGHIVQPAGQTATVLVFNNGTLIAQADAATDGNFRIEFVPTSGVYYMIFIMVNGGTTTQSIYSLYIQGGQKDDRGNELYSNVFSTAAGTIVPFGDIQLSDTGRAVVNRNLQGNIVSVRPITFNPVRDWTVRNTVTKSDCADHPQWQQYLLTLHVNYLNVSAIRITSDDGQVFAGSLDGTFFFMVSGADKMQGFFGTNATNTPVIQGILKKVGTGGCHFETWFDSQLEVM